MTGGVLGGGVIFVVAALLWAAVLVPAWTRRREFRAAERNALRLQRTLRILAETSEVPQEVRLEATAKEALAHEKLLRTAQKQQQAERAADLAEAKAEQLRAEIRAQEMRRRQAAAQRSAKLRRPAVRRLRAVSALGALCGVVGAFVGLGAAVAGSGPAILIWSSLVVAASGGALVLLAPGRVKLAEIPAERVPVPAAAPEARFDDGAAPEEDAAAQAAAHAEAQRAAAERIERARALARARAERPRAQENQPDSMLLREAREQVSRARAAEDRGATRAADGTADQRVAASRDAVAEGRSVVRTPGWSAGAGVGTSAEPMPRAAAAPRQAPAARASAEQRAAAERLRRMGVVGDTSVGAPDLDAAFRRRRSAG
ncbi:hypothetical protein MUN77_11810 [Leucobacter allii]|uniref:hypothetical protein n=1 Tax=Leucobacter allii TaxID=2932247 RepID=UPI001FD5C062|nr:hypothetical protein [Leucobacter allii]UOR00826.1 hypothetical protein MUN77_11810 [Leucobacter allii]